MHANLVGVISQPSDDGYFRFGSRVVIVALLRIFDFHTGRDPNYSSCGTTMSLFHVSLDYGVF